MGNLNVIGIVGGVGPYAGIDLANKILNLTKSGKDQDHLSIILLSMPSLINDRSAFLLGEAQINPAYAIVKMIVQLEHLGVSVVGIPCNTVHAPSIFNVIQEELIVINCQVKLLNMIQEVTDYIYQRFSGISRIGVLSTNGVYQTQIYRNYLEKKGFKVLLPDQEMQNNLVHRSIYDPFFGIKAQTNPVTEKAKQNLYLVIDYLREQGADAIILGCTELCLAITEEFIENVIILDSTMILARSLITEIAPDKLKNDMNQMNKHPKLGQNEKEIFTTPKRPKQVVAGDIVVSGIQYPKRKSGNLPFL